DDSEDMVLYGVLLDAVNVGWVSSLEVGSPESIGVSRTLAQGIITQIGRDSTIWARLDLA
ncbi:ethylene-responsive transcription factor 1A-like, partial [Trifolium medium]|nr:ethylene-responsive transcription factor 1A-like [Trifolium medium]